MVVYKLWEINLLYWGRNRLTVLDQISLGPEQLHQEITQSVISFNNQKTVIRFWDCQDSWGVSWPLQIGQNLLFMWQASGLLCFIFRPYDIHRLFQSTRYFGLLHIILIVEISNVLKKYVTIFVSRAPFYQSFYSINCLFYNLQGK